MMLVVLAGAALLLCGRAAALDPGCAEPVSLLDDASRRVGGAGAPALYCDATAGRALPDAPPGYGPLAPAADWASAGGAWVRLVEPAGTQLATAPPSVRQACGGPVTQWFATPCGSVAGGWLVGEHPADTDGPVQRLVCFEFNGDACMFSKVVDVLSCGDHYRYRLGEPPAQCLRFCGINASDLATPCTTPTTTTTVDTTIAIGSTTTTAAPTTTAAGPDPCTQPYREFVDTHRAAAYYNTSTVACDDLQSTTPALDWAGPGLWYRFTKAAGLRMTATDPGAGRCGTRGSGWLQGAHPAVSDGVVQRQVFVCLFIIL